MAEAAWPAVMETLYGQRDVIVPLLTSKFGVRIGGEEGAADLFSSSVSKIMADLTSGLEIALPHRSLRAWLFTITHNRAIDAIRREERPRVHPTATARTVSSSHELAEAAERPRSVVALIQSTRSGLNSNQRAILINDLAKHFALPDHEGPFTDDELAARLNVCKQSVWNLRHQARERIAPLLSEFLDDA